MKLLLDIKNVTGGYSGTPVLKNVNLQVSDQDFIGIIGPNGGGKTTLLKLILGLLKPSIGSINFHGKMGLKRPIIGYLPQINKIDTSFPITTSQVVESGLFCLPKSKRKKIDVKSWIETTLNELNLTDISRQPIGELSGGQLQRVFLGRAIICKPKLLILDEPDTFMDNVFEGKLYEKLKELNEEMAILLVSHDLGTISSYVKTIACVNGTLHLHNDNKLTQEQLENYNCPIKVVSHGEVSHTVLKHH